MSNQLTVSVILPTFNRMERLKRVLAGLEAQEYPKEDFEVIVISDGSTDGTDVYLQTVKTDLQLVPIFQKNQGPAAARNAGLARAVGELIVFVDDDVIPTPQLIAEHVRSHRGETGDVAVIGPMLTPTDYPITYWVRWSQEKLADQYDAMKQSLWQPLARQFYTGNASFPRRLYLAYGGFDVAFHRAEDVELAYRYEQQGVQFRFNERAAGYHFEERSFKAWSRIAYDYGRFEVVFTQKKKYIWLLPLTFHDFVYRHPFIRWTVRLCLDRQLMSKAVIETVNLLANIGDKLRLHSLRRLGCSIIFNFHYYQGISDELGGRKAFFAAARTPLDREIVRVIENSLHLKSPGTSSPEQI